MVPVSGDPAQGTVRVTQRIYFAHAAVMNRRKALQIDSPCLAYECLSHPQKMSATNPPARTAIAKAIVIFMASPYRGWYCASHSSTLKAKQHTTPSLGNHRQIMRFPYNKRFMPRYSIVVPLHNEQENVTDLYDRLKAVMEANGETFELVLVDDGSDDNTFPMLREIAAVDSRVTVVKLRRNFGQTAGLAAGLDPARGLSHYGISRTFRVFFDLITIRFLLRYLSRPLHFFGTVGMLSILSGFSVAGWLVFEKLLRHSDLLIQHGPLMIFAAVLFLAGLNMLAVGLLGEMQVRHYHEPTRRAPYSVDRVLRAQSEEHTVSE